MSWVANIGARVPCPPKLPIPPRVGRGSTVSPNYAALIEVLVTLPFRPDHLGEARLDSKEAGRIRACGFTARAGKWRSPLLPHELVEGTTLRHLFDKLHHRYGKVKDARLGYWYYKRARPISIAPKDPLSKLERRFLDYIRHHGPTRRRRLQRRFWRMPAAAFKATLERLAAEDRIGLADGWVFASPSVPV